jgi:hypothetical protein
VKTHLLSVPLSEEDGDIWLIVVRPWGRRYGMVQQRVLDAANRADARDADLMWELVDLRSIGAYADVRHLQAVAGQDGFSAGGWMHHYRWTSPKWSDGSPIK